MSHIADNDRAAARCDECGNIYTVTIHSGGEVVPVGVPNCRGCGGTEFTIFGDLGKELIETEK